MYLTHCSQGRMSGIGITKPVYITREPMKTAPGAMDAVRVRDIAPIVLKIIDPAIKLVKANR